MVKKEKNQFAEIFVFLNDKTLEPESFDSFRLYKNGGIA
jgi:hypothetical protein